MTDVSNETFRNQHGSHIAVLRAIFGKRLAELSRTQCFFNGALVLADDGDVELRFHDGSVITLSLLSDGQSVGASTEAVRVTQSFSLDNEGACLWQKLALSDVEPWRALVGAKVTRISAFVDNYGSGQVAVLSGWLIAFGKFGYLCYGNIGDDSKLLYNANLPQDDTVETREWLIASDT